MKASYDFSGLDELFNEAFGLTRQKETKKVEVNPTYTRLDDTLIVSYDLPGAKKSEIDLDVEDQIIVVKGSEGRYDGLVSKVRIGQDYDMKSVDATLQDGVLKVTISKGKKAKTTIQIK